MYRTRLRTVGGSVMFSIPKEVLESLDLAANASVGLSIANGTLIVEANPMPRYSLAELMAQCDVSTPPSAEDTEWLDDQPVGREAI